jgi:outer membrane protein TolC
LDFPIRAALGPARLLGSVALIAVLAGCDIGPAFLKPAVEAPKAWVTPPQNPQTEWPSPDWWQAFGSPELDRLMAQAQTANFDIAAAAARIIQADAQAKIAGAPLLPSIGAAGSVTRSATGPDAPGIGNPPAAYTSTATATASYEIDFWGKNKAALDAAHAAAIATRYDRETIALGVVGSVASTYFQILATRDRIEVLRQNIDRSQNVLEALRTEEQVGAGSALDVAQQETTVAGLRAQ